MRLAVSAVGLAASRSRSPSAPLAKHLQQQQEEEEALVSSH